MSFPFAPSLLGGLLIGAGASLLLWGAGQTAGVSGIAAGLVRRGRSDWGWRLLFLAGLVVGGLAFEAYRPGAIGTPPGSLPVLAGAGLLVGFGTRLGGGCTSGHGVCGLSRLSQRSLVAVAVFMATAALTVWLLAFTGART